MSSDAPKPVFKSVEVKIFNQIYSLRTARDAEHIRRVAQLVDERMRLISAHATTHDLAKIAIFAALNIADEFDETKDYYERELEALLSRSLEQEMAQEQQPPPQEAERAAEPTAADDAETSHALTAAPVIETTSEAQLKATEPVEIKATDPPPDKSPNEQTQSWFEAIFDAPEAPKERSERLSSRVSAKLQRLRQPNLDAPLTIEEDN